MDINNNRSLSLADYLSVDFSSNTSTKTKSTFDEIYSKSTSSSSKKYDDNKVDRSDKKADLKDKIDTARDDFDKSSNYDKIGQSKNDNFVDAREKTTNDSTNSKEVSKTDETSDVSDTTKTGNKKDVKELDKDNLTDEEKYKLAKISEILGVPVNQIIDKMNELQISIEDLADGENVKDLLMSLNGFSVRADLLTVNNLKDMLESVQAIASEDVSEEEIQSFLNQMKNLGNADDLADQTSDDTVSNEQQTDNTTQVTENAANTANQDTNTSSDDENSDDVEVENVEIHSAATTDYTGVQQATNDASATGATVSNEMLTNNEVNSDMPIGVQDIKTTQTQSFVSRVANEMGRSNVDTESVVKQLTESMKVEVKGDITNEIKIALRPSHLGDVTLKIITENGIVTAQFEAESQRVKEIIESNFNQLKQTLEEQGVSVGNLEVNVRSDNPDNTASTNLGQNSNSSGRGQGNEGSDLVGEEVQETVIEESVALGSTNSFKA